MKRNLLVCIICLVFGANICLAQPKYKAKYQQKKDDTFDALFREMTDNGWLYFKDDVRISPDAFICQYAKNLGLSEGYHLKAVKDETEDQEQTKIRHIYTSMPSPIFNELLNTAERANTDYGKKPLSQIVSWIKF